MNCEILIIDYNGKDKKLNQSIQEKNMFKRSYSSSVTLLTVIN